MQHNCLEDVGAEQPDNRVDYRCITILTRPEPAKYPKLRVTALGPRRDFERTSRGVDSGGTVRYAWLLA